MVETLWRDIDGDFYGGYTVAIHNKLGIGGWSFKEQDSTVSGVCCYVIESAKSKIARSVVCVADASSCCSR
jgi:hypothetical protein